MTPVQTERRSDEVQRPSRLLDQSAVAGWAIAFGGIAAAFALQGGEPGDLLQWHSALLVVFGTVGAVVVTSPYAVVKEAVVRARQLLHKSADPRPDTFELLTRLSRKAKRLGLVSLEHDLAELPTTVLQRGLRLATDGLPAKDVLQTMRLETRLEVRRLQAHVRIFEAAGGYAPTLGVLGAVLGLIGVMKHIDQIALVGHSVSSAFTSTVYGLALANLVFLPIAGRLRAAAANWLEEQEMLMEGVAMLMEGAHPLVVEERLKPYTGEAPDMDRAASHQRGLVAVAKGA